MAQKNWELSGEYMESCNCATICVPAFSRIRRRRRRTKHCTALMVYRIDRGRHGGPFPRQPEVRPGDPLFQAVMADGGWVFGCVVDETASEAKRQALGSIVSGKAGGPPGMIRDDLVSDFRGVEFRKIDFTADGLRRATRYPGDPRLRHRRRGLAQSFWRAVLHRQHRPSANRGHRARASKTEVKGFGLDLQPDRQGQQWTLRALCLGGRGET